jgi:hypothetical protein
MRRSRDEDLFDAGTVEHARVRLSHRSRHGLRRDWLHTLLIRARVCSVRRRRVRDPQLRLRMGELYGLRRRLHDGSPFRRLELRDVWEGVRHQ